MESGLSGRNIFKLASLENPAVCASLKSLQNRSINRVGVMPSLSAGAASEMGIPLGGVGKKLPVERDKRRYKATGSSIRAHTPWIFRKTHHADASNAAFDDVKAYDGPPPARVKKRLTRYFGILLVSIGLIVIGILLGAPVYRLVVANWKSILLVVGWACLGSGFILIVRQVGKNPLKRVVAPDGKTEEPLQELEEFAKRAASRLRTAYHMQICLTGLVALFIFGVIVWSIIMVTQERFLQAQMFGSGGVGMFALSTWKWQPFDRIELARKLADEADLLVTMLRLRRKNISEIEDPKVRADEQWKATHEYTKYFNIPS